MATNSQNTVVYINQLGSVSWKAHPDCDFSISDKSDVWRIGISTNVHLINNLWPLLSADEHERANRYYRKNDKQRFIISRAALRILVGKYLDQDPQQIAFEIGDNKKPHVRNSGGISFHYNISHSGDYVLAAFSDSELGVDVEKPDSNLHYSDMMNITFSPAEIDHVNQSENSIESFYTLWTRKEALLKATGKGIDDDLKLIPCTDGTHTVSSNMIGSNQNWITNTFIIASDHVGSVATAYEKNCFWEFSF